MEVEAVVKSGKGFYVGDVCYVLGDRVYHGEWGRMHSYADGVWEDPKTGFSFAVAGTAYGDGSYFDGEGHEYGVDAGVIGIVPLELVEKESGLELGRVFEGSGEAEFEADDGVFYIRVNGGNYVIIDTKEEEEEDEEYWDDDDDDEMGYDPYLGCYTDDV